MFNYTSMLTFFSQIQWASTESQIEECLMKGREKVRDIQFMNVYQYVLNCVLGSVAYIDYQGKSSNSQLKITSIYKVY